MSGQTSCDACTTCSAGFFVSAVCTASSDAACSACDPSCATCTGPGANQCSTCPSGEQLVGGQCQSSLCGTAPDPVCLVAGQAQLQSNDAHSGKETLKLRWAKIATTTTRASFGNPVSGSTVAAFCLFNDAGTPVGELIVDRAGKTCGTKPCWRLTGKGLAYQDKMASAAGVTKIGFVGGAAGKGKASAQGKNNAANGLTSLPKHLSAMLTGNTSPTIELVTSDRFCVRATMNKVVKDAALQYKAQKK